MYSYHLSILIPLYFFLHPQIFSVASSNSPGLYYQPLDDIAVNCGSTGKSVAADGRHWAGDIGSNYIISHGFKGKSISSTKTSLPFSPDPVPYLTARISHSQFAYTFHVTPGQKFVRLHFYPASYPGFKRSKAFFTVKSGPYTLLSNFSVSLAADALGTQSLVKEYCVYVGENQLLILTFSPSSGGSYDDVHAFVNGIEIISMPAGLYHTQEGDQGARVIGKRDRFTVDNSIALEKVHRLNVGGISISPMEDTGMFRDWSEDSNYLLQSRIQPVATTIRVKYTTIPSYTAPQKVYQTSWSMAPDKQANNALNFSWKLSVDLGFRYLLRLHFCELEYEIKESAQTEFSIFVNEKVAEAKADLIKWSGGNGVALYRDYVLTMEGDRMEGKCDLLIVLSPHKSHYTDATLKGLELFKLSNPDNNLAGVNPLPEEHASTSSKPNAQKLVFASGGNAIATGVVILLTLVNIIVHQLSIWNEKHGEMNISPSLSEGLCRRFSLAEVLSVTNNFNDELVIGSGGFGKVYKALIDDGTTTVAIKRLNSKSNQGADEFWTEIETLSHLRHTHLVSLIGYCDERHEMILVYDYMEHGTLADHLYKIYAFGNGIIGHLSWEQRVNICIGVARGLDYLHIGTRHGIIHRDVKSTNILLDKDWVAKISDFGLCKVGTTSHSHSHVSTDVKGTFGYLDPEYFLTHRLTKKSDVYAFGVVLLEVLCGRPAVDTRLEEEQHSLSLWAQQCIKDNKLDQLIDPSLRDQISPQCLKAFAEVANKCLHSRPNGRPSMADVVVSLECLLASEDPCRVPSRELEEVEDLEDDDDHATPASPPRPILPSPTSPGNSATGAIAGGVAAGAARFFATQLAKWRRRKPQNRFFDVPAEENPVVHLGQRKRFSLRELKVATDNFSNRNMLGRGALGKIYKGRLADGSLVAVKRLREERTQHGELRFQAEVEMINVAVHRNLLRLRGFCITPTERLLVYPYMANGSVASCLRERSEFQPPLDWPIRKRIALGSARGLAYLHDYCGLKIIHRDVKAANILLDEEFEAAVGEFGLAKLMDYRDTHVTTAVRGTIGFIAPEYLATGKSSEKTNVFGYGVMLLELITGQGAFDLARLANDDDVMLLDWVKGLLRERNLETVVDADLQGNYIYEEVEQLIQVALLCTQGSPKERPKMSEVVRMLEGEGLRDRREERQNEEILRREYNHTHHHNDDWIIDSFSNLRPEELSGPR